MITSYFASKKRKAEADTKPSSSSPSTPATTCSEVSTTSETDSSSTTKKAKQHDDAVQEMLEHLNDSLEDEVSSWRKALDKHFSSNRFGNLAKFVASQRKSATVYPPPQDVFSALNLCPLDQIKVVIIGQDPYHGPNQGHGLCFSVRKGVAIPPSLKNIYKELQNDPKVDFKMPNHGYLERWGRQGVLLLNAVLTVRRGEANSHKGKGWEETTDEILRALVRRPSNKGIVFLLWGRPASKKMESVLNGNRKHQMIISSSHPSPLGATKTNAPFLGSRCFSRANEALKQMGYDPIDWNVDGDLRKNTSDAGNKKSKKILVDV